MQRHLSLLYSFLLPNNIPSSRYTNIWFISSSVERHLELFPGLRYYEQCCYEHSRASICADMLQSLGCISMSGIPGHILTLVLLFWATANCFPKWLHQFHILINNVWGSQFLHMLINIFFSFIILFERWYLIVVLIWISPMANQTFLNVFSCAYWLFVYLPWRSELIQIFCQLKNSVVFSWLSCKSSLYVLDANLLSDTWFASIFL